MHKGHQRQGIQGIHSHIYTSRQLFWHFQECSVFSPNGGLLLFSLNLHIVHYNTHYNTCRLTYVSQSHIVGHCGFLSVIYYYLDELCLFILCYFITCISLFVVFLIMCCCVWTPSKTRRSISRGLS